jgi:hypothetical protein
MFFCQCIPGKREIPSGYMLNVTIDMDRKKGAKTQIADIVIGLQM